MPHRPAVHRPAGYQDRDARRAAYGSTTRLYNLRLWRRIRIAYLAQHPLCECGCGYAATVVDHKIPHQGDRELMFDWDNLQAMTKPCHDRKTATQDSGFAQRGSRR
jgi:5-methylcytosine-specific restriction protein A